MTPWPRAVYRLSIDSETSATFGGLMTATAPGSLPASVQTLEASLVVAGTLSAAAETP